MKSAVIFFIVAFVAFANAADSKKLLMNNVRGRLEECAVTEKASKDEVENIVKLKVPTTHEGKCVLFCVHKMFNVQDPDGTLNVAATLEALEMFRDGNTSEHFDEVLDAIKVCADIKRDADPCNYAADLVTCAIQKAKDIGVEEFIIL